MHKILIINDSRLIRMKLKKYLTGRYNVVEAENGRDGQIKVKLENPDCILTDLLMPVMDGFELLGWLSNSDIETPAIVLTADIQDETAQRCKELGAFKVLNKPPNSDDLYSALDSALALQD